MIPRTPSGDTLKTGGGGSSSASRLRDKRSSRVAVAIAAMLSLVFTTFAGTATAYASPEDPSVQGFDEQFDPDAPQDRDVESDPLEGLGDDNTPPPDLNTGDDDPSKVGPTRGTSLFSNDLDEDEDDSMGISPFAAGDPYFPSDAPGVIYSSTGDGQVDQVTYNATDGTYTKQAFGSKAPGVSSFNGLGISPGVGREMYAYERSGSNPTVSSATVYSFNQAKGEWDNTKVTVDSKASGMGGAIQFIAGAVDPNGNFYMGGYSTDGSAYRIYKYTPGVGGSSGSVAYVGYVDTSSIVGGTNGDMDFDKLGNLYITRCCGTYGTTVISVSAAALASPGTNNGITATIAQTVGGSQMPAVTGVTFDSSGHMFLGSSTDLRVYNMPAVNNEVKAKGSALNSSDLASAASPPIINLQKNVDGKRFEDTDQFTLALESKISAADWQLIADKTTTGTANGIQAEHVGPFPVTVGTTLKVTERPAETTDFKNYKTSLECVSGQGAPVELETSGGVEGTFNYPAGVTSVTCTFTNKAMQPGLHLTKSGSPDPYKVGDKITYDFTVTNTGNTPLNAIHVKEGNFTGSGTLGDPKCELDALAPAGEQGDSTTCVVTYTATQADVDQGSLFNDAVAYGTRPGTDPATDEPWKPQESNKAEETLRADLDPKLDLTKAATLKVQEDDEEKYLPFLATDFVEGGTITYLFEVSNVGNVALHDVTVGETSFTGTGTKPVVECPLTTLPMGESMQCTADYVITAEDVEVGAITNEAVAKGFPPNPEDPEEPGEPVESPPADAQAPSAAIALEKTADTEKFVAGEEINYSFKITNLGEVELTDVSVNEQCFNGKGGAMSDVICAQTPLAPGASMTCSATYTPTQEDVDYGRLDNVAIAQGTPPGEPERPSEPIYTPPSRVEIPADQAPALELEKVADTNPYSEGDLITYTFTVTNAGNVTLSNVFVDETAFDGENNISEVSCPGTVLAPEASMECTATYTATLADVDQGSLTNEAVARGETPPNPATPEEPGEPVNSGPAEEIIDALWEPALVPSKSVDPESGTAVLPDTELTYTLTFANTEGRVAAEVAYTDVLSGLRQNADVDEESLVAEDGLEAVFDSNGNIGVTGSVPAGETRTVTFKVTSKAGASNMVTNVLVETPPPGEEPPAPGDCEPGDPLCVENPIPALDLQKYATKKVEVDGEIKYLPFIANDFVAGGTITYLFQVSNVGGVVLNDIQVNETEFSGSGTIPAVSCPTTPLPVGESMQCTGDYVITESDVEAGEIDNAAVATGNPPTGPPPVSPPAEAKAPAANITLVKTADKEQFEVGEKVTYTFTVTNDGEVDLRDVKVNEVSFNGDGELSAVECPTTTLGVSESMECTATYVPTQGDMDRGWLNNVADAEGTPPGDPNDPSRPGEPLQSPPDEVKIPGAEHDPALKILKTADKDEFKVGEELTYTFKVTNAGNVTLTNVKVNEVSFNGDGELSEVSCPSAVLAPDTSMDCTATYVPTQADMDRGEITNAAAAAGTPPADPSDPSKPSEPIETPPSKVEVPGLQDPALGLVKTSDKQKVTKAGEVVTYTFEVTNTGNVTLTDVKVEETKFSGKGSLPQPTCAETTLAPGESTVCTTKYTVVVDDLKAKEITNVAVAAGETPSDPNDPDTPGTPVKSDPDEAKVLVQPPVVPGKPSLPKTGAALSLGLLGVAALGAGAILRRKVKPGAFAA